VPITVTVSIGIGVYPDHATSGQQVLDAADDALVAAKAAGRDTYRLALVRARPEVEEIAVPAGAVSPEDGPPRAGAQPGAGQAAASSGPAGGVRHAPVGGASSGPHPPRQSRGR
jgi:hypothetical protein